MKLSPSPALVKKSLSNHQFVGVLIGAMMYLVCLTGTIAVLYQELERWEQPTIPEYDLSEVDLKKVSTRLNDILGNELPLTDHLYVNLPSETMPRVSLANEEKGYFTDAEGNIVREVAHDWTHMLINLHLYLHLPNNVGIVLVSALGALLCGLVISGLLAHPNILKDAFSLRLGGSKQLEQVDIHNRLSVWGLPFHIMIGITGAYFGLALPALALVSGISGYDRDAITEAMFGQEPHVQQTTQSIDIKKLIDETHKLAPEAEPFMIVVHEAGTEKQFAEVHGTLPGRLIYSEQWRFNTDGQFLGKGGYSDGEAGKQAVYSIYRLHFGHFGGFGIKLIYLFLGGALTIVSATGITIWLTKRRYQDGLNVIWPGFIWGSMIGLTISALARVILGIPAAPVFWLTLLGCVVLAAAQKHRQIEVILKLLLVASLGLLLASHAIKFGSAAFVGGAGIVNLSLLLLAGLLVWVTIKDQQTDTETTHRPPLSSPPKRGY